MLFSIFTFLKLTENFPLIFQLDSDSIILDFYFDKISLFFTDYLYEALICEFIGIYK
jgi:hypothetical protein